MAQTLNNLAGRSAEGAAWAAMTLSINPLGLSRE